MSDSIEYCEGCETNLMCHLERKCMLGDRSELSDTHGSIEFFHSGNKDKDMLDLLNMAYDIVEIWKTDASPYNDRLRRCWLKRAKELGAIPSW